ncbi:4'-phosphopantetheinyl transferase superfamily protein [Francisellaceae bacterium CB300]
MIDKFVYESQIVNGVELFLLDIRENLNNLHLDIIPNAQVSDIQQYKLEQDRNKRLLARNFLYFYLQNKYSVTNFELDYNDYKKPFLENYQNIDFSISYSNDFILIGVSGSHKIGVDIEYIDKSINHDELKDIIMHPSEITYYNQLKTKDERAEFFFEVFNTKESIIKSMGMGLYFDVKNINILENINDYLMKSSFFENILDNYKVSLTYSKPS